MGTTFYRLVGYTVFETPVACIGAMCNDVFSSKLIVPPLRPCFQSIAV